MMKNSRWLRHILIFVLGIAIGMIGILVYQRWKSNPLMPFEKVEVKELPLNKYSFERLVERQDEVSEIEMGEVLYTGEEYTSYLITYQSLGKKVTGQLNVPVAEMPEEGWPVIVMLRGWVDPSIYSTGVGTRNGAAYFASNGYVTVAPDFLGYGGSDQEAEDSIEARLQKPVQVLDLIASLRTLDNVDLGNVSMWGHSNGGQIGLSVLEVLGKRGVSVPATFWAPVSKPFPYSVLYYTDESEDKGKALRRVIAEFEREYDVAKFSVDEYYGWIVSPLQIHQGTADDAVPWEWSEELSNDLEGLDKNVKFFLYSGADHNMRPAWDTVVRRDLEFFVENDDSN